MFAPRSHLLSRMDDISYVAISALTGYRVSVAEAWLAAVWVVPSQVVRVLYTRVTLQTLHVILAGTLPSRLIATHPCRPVLCTVTHPATIIVR